MRSTEVKQPTKPPLYKRLKCFAIIIIIIIIIIICSIY